MDYKKVYDAICKRGQERKLEGYSEVHHIVPKCMGGLDVSENLTILTGREHFIAHWLLARHYNTNKLWHAFFCMTKLKNPNQEFRYTPSSRAIEEAKEARSRMLIGNKYATGKRTEEAKDKMREAKLKNPTRYWRGKTIPEEVKARIASTLSKKFKGIPKRKVTCPHCNKEGGEPQMKRWHFDNCTA